MDQTMKARLTSGNLWLRALYMIFFVLAYGVAEVVLVLVVLFQFVHILFAGSANEAALRLGAALSAYIRQVLDYQTFNSEERPFPFTDWPEEAAGGERWRKAPENDGGEGSVATAEEPPAPEATAAPGAAGAEAAPTADEVAAGTGADADAAAKAEPGPRDTPDDDSMRR